MKCTQCGHTKFSEVRLSLSEGGWVESVDAYACLNCGHIELYLPEIKIKAIKDEIKREKETEKYNKKLEIEKQELNQVKEKLMIIIDDENSTVKSVREATEKLVEINKNLKKAQKKFKSKNPW